MANKIDRDCVCPHKFLGTSKAGAMGSTTPARIRASRKCICAPDTCRPQNGTRTASEQVSKVGSNLENETCPIASSLDSPPLGEALWRVRIWDDVATPIFIASCMSANSAISRTSGAPILAIRSEVAAFPPQSRKDWRIQVWNFHSINQNKLDHNDMQLFAWSVCR